MDAGKEYRVVIDQSTSGTKLLLVKIENQEPSIIKRLDKPHRQIYPRSGWVEHDPVEIVDNVEMLFSLLMEETGLKPEDIKSLSITNQRETIVVWNKKTGKPITNALVWQCNRSIDICNQLISEGKEPIVQEKTGLKMDTYFSAPKLKWLFQESNQLDGILGTDELAVGTMDTWLIWNLTNREVFATEPSNASRTLLYNIHSEQWDEELCQLFNTPIKSLSHVRDSNETFGEYKGIPIVGVMADSQSALYGQELTTTGNVKATLGTGCSIMMQIENNRHWGNDTILKTIAWKIDNQTSYALEGIIRSCTDTLNWLSNELDLFNTVEEGSEIAFSVPDSGGVFLIPAQLGLGAPFWKPEAKAMFLGLNRSSTKAHLIRAGFDSIVYQIKAVLDVMEETTGINIKELRIDGGASKNEKLMQLLADTLQKGVIVNEIEEMSALGVLMMTTEFSFEKRRRKLYLPVDLKEKEYENWFEQVKKNF